MTDFHTRLDIGLRRASELLKQEAERGLPDYPQLGMANTMDRKPADDVMLRAKEIVELRAAIGVIDGLRANRAVLSQLAIEDPEVWLQQRDRLLKIYIGMARKDLDLGIENPREHHLVRSAYLAGYDQGARP